MLQPQSGSKIVLNTRKPALKRLLDHFDLSHDYIADLSSKGLLNEFKAVSRNSAPFFILFVETVFYPKSLFKKSGQKNSIWTLRIRRRT